MTINIRNDAPLESLLAAKAASLGQSFPNRGINYFDRYVQIKQHLASKYYQVTSTGLAAGGHRFTKHDITHVDDVIHRAGHLLGIQDGGLAPFSRLEPFEVFVLLYAILLHDAGNAYERAGHEARVFNIIQEMGSLCPLEDAEKLLVASIAQAHGGRTDNGDKDTIPHVISEDVSSVSNIDIHGRRLAAVLRLADELSENPRRADEIALKNEGGVSFLPNFYCKTIDVKIDTLSGAISLKHIMYRNFLEKKYIDPENNNELTYIVDYIAKRINKCDQERRYCNRFLSGFAVMSYLRATLKIFDGHKLVDEIPVDLSDTGYPGVEQGVVQREFRFSGQLLKDQFFQLSASQVGQP